MVLLLKRTSKKFNLDFIWNARSQTVLFGLLIFLFVGKTIVPAWHRYGTDIPNYYLVARLYREHRSVERVYQWIWLQRQEDHSDIGPHLVGFIPSTPISALLLAPLSSLPILQVHRYWLIVNITVLLLVVALLKRITALKWIQIAVLMLLATNPLHMHFVVGQMHLVVLLLLTAAAALYFEDRHFWCGLTLAAAAAMKIYPALFLLYFLVRKKWRALLGLAVGMAAVGLAWIYLFGADSFFTYSREVLPWGLRGENIDPYNVGWDSLNALLHRLLIAEPELNPSPVVHWPSLYAFLQSTMNGIIVVAFLWGIASNRGDQSRKKLEWGSYLFLLVLLSSEPLTYHFVALILSVVLVVDYLIARNEMTKAAMVTLVYIFICLPYNRLYQYNPAGWKSVLFFPRLFFMMIFAGLMLRLLFSSPSEFADRRSRLNNLKLAAAAVVLLSLGGFAENLYHLRGHFQNYAARLLTVPGSVMAADPVVTSRGVLYTTLVTHRHTAVQDAYAAQEYRTGSVHPFYLGNDSYHPAATSSGDVIWVEVATRTGSRIVRFPTDPTDSAVDTALEVEDAEEPVVSSDGEWLAFIREAGGRNSLWVHPLQSQRGNKDRQLAGSDYDVREAAFFPDHRIVFSSRRDGRFRFYLVDSASGAIEQMSLPGCSARYPAVSPDGRWLAFSCEHRGYWQLHWLDLKTGQQTQLTEGECNCVSPAWTGDSQSLVYATDCGRGLGMTALAQLRVEH